jgi:hypothetical protein
VGAALPPTRLALRAIHPPTLRGGGI